MRRKYPNFRRAQRGGRSRPRRAASAGTSFWLPTAIGAASVFGLVLFWPGDDGGSAAEPSSGARFTCTVTGVHDGDGPIYCAEGPKIRLTAIAARELDETCSPGHPCPATSGASARDALTRLATGQTLSCEATGTSYSRITAWCWTPAGVELNCAMVQGGYAVRWDKFDLAGRLCR